MTKQGFEEMEQPTKKQYEYNQKEIGDIIMGKREAVKPQSNMFNNHNHNERMRELQEKAEEGTLTAEETGELFRLSAGIEQTKE